MVTWIIILALVAVVAGALGFTRVSSVAGGGAKILLAILVIGFLFILLLFYLFAGGATV